MSNSKPKKNILYTETTFQAVLCGPCSLTQTFSNNEGALTLRRASTLHIKFSLLEKGFVMPFVSLEKALQSLRK